MSQLPSPRSPDAPHGAHEAPEPEHSRGGREQQRPPRRWWVVLLIAAVALGLDILTKSLAVADLAGPHPVRLFGGAVYLDLLRNSGSAFDITHATLAISIVAIAVALGILCLAPRVRSVGWAVGLGLVLAGALGNLSDRVFRPPAPLHGEVIDFISLGAACGHYWPVFNIADSSICVGAVVIVLMALAGREYDGKRARRRRVRPDPAAGSDPESRR